MRCAAALLALATLLGAFALAGCGEQRKPVPVIHVTVLAEPGTYLLENERLYLTELKTALQKVADKFRRPTTRDARAQVIVAHSSRIPYHRVEEVIGMCVEVGLTDVRTEIREEAAPRP
jgi:biopolymer transport protein ExbD